MKDLNIVCILLGGLLICGLLFKTSVPVEKISSVEVARNLEQISFIQPGAIAELDNGDLVVVKEISTADKIARVRGTVGTPYILPFTEFAWTMKTIHQYGDKGWQEMAYRFLIGQSAPQAQTLEVPTFDISDLTQQ